MLTKKEGTPVLPTRKRTLAPKRVPASRHVSRTEQSTCPVRDVLDRVGDKWTVLVILLLGEGPQRFTALKRSIEGISQRMLTLTLRRLEADRLVRRDVEPTIPPAVHYELTPLGRSLTQALEPLMRWAQQHRSNFGR